MTREPKHPYDPHETRTVVVEDGCEVCGCTRVTINCPICGAPNCCPVCCIAAEEEYQIDQMYRDLAAGK